MTLSHLAAEAVAVVVIAVVVVAVVVVAAAAEGRNSTPSSPRSRPKYPRHIPKMGWVMPPRHQILPQHRIQPVQRMLFHSIELGEDIEGEVGITAMKTLKIDTGEEGVGVGVGVGVG